MLWFPNAMWQKTQQRYLQEMLLKDRDSCKFEKNLKAGSSKSS